jgi:hypothetical protein
LDYDGKNISWIRRDNIVKWQQKLGKKSLILLPAFLTYQEPMNIAVISQTLYTTRGCAAHVLFEGKSSKFTLNAHINHSQISRLEPETTVLGD